MSDKWMRTICRVSLSLLALLLVGLGGCQRYHDVSAFATPATAPVDQTPYRVAPPDLISVRSMEATEINTPGVAIGPDGSIDLPLVGRVEVAGMTAGEIADELEARAGEFYQDVDVAVSVVSFRSQHVYVFGEVGGPGRYAYNGSDTVLDLLARAQPTRLADPNRIQVLRPSPDGKTAERMTIELNKWVEEGLVDRNALLKSGDIIYVPPSGLARVGLTLQQLLLPLQPAASVVNAPMNIDEAAGRYGSDSGQAGQ